MKLIFKRIRFVLFGIPHHNKNPLFKGDLINFDDVKIKCPNTGLLDRAKIDRKVKLLLK